MGEVVDVTAVTATSARATQGSHLPQLIDQVNDDSEPVTMTGQRGNAVLVGEKDWRAIQETLFLATILGMTESIRQATLRRYRNRCYRARLVSSWQLVVSRQAQKDAQKLASSGLKPKAQRLLAVLAEDPFAMPPRC